jgi:hypothetical protein
VFKGKAVNSYAASARAQPGGDKCQGLLKGQLRALAPFLIVLSALASISYPPLAAGCGTESGKRRGMGEGGGEGATEADAGGGRGGMEEGFASGVDDAAVETLCTGNSAHGALLCIVLFSDTHTISHI